MVANPTLSSTNLSIAGNLREIADILETQDADHFRVNAYRHAADTVSALDVPVDHIFEHSGVERLIALPAIAEMITTGRWIQLERLRGAVEPEALFQTVPGIGPHLADSIHQELHIDTLEALETAAHDGRLAQVPGVGPRRIEIVKATLGERLGRRRIRPARHTAPPPVADVLGVDAEYRKKAAAGTLKKIAPKRFNPSADAWLPVLHTQRDDWSYTALFSNTRRAHELGRTSDWVVIYHHSDHMAEGQCTVVSETRGPLKGRRVVRGRERECNEYYRQRVAVQPLVA